MKAVQVAFVGVVIALGLPGCGDEGATPEPGVVTAPLPAAGPSETRTETPTAHPTAPAPQPAAPVELDEIAEIVFEATFDVADRSKVGEDAWNRMRREFAGLYVAEMKKNAFDAFEQPFEDAMEALRKKYGVAEPKHE